MTDTPFAIAELSRVGNVPQAYQHHEKLVTAGEDFSLPGFYLKWYDIRRSEVAVSQELSQESRAVLKAAAETGTLNIENQLGFVLLHLCDAVIFVIVVTWRNANEMWETVYVKDLVHGGSFQPLVTNGHRPTFCVWELGAVWHEQQAWVRYLYSRRDDEAKSAYLNDRFTGLV